MCRPQLISSEERLRSRHATRCRAGPASTDGLHAVHPSIELEFTSSAHARRLSARPVPSTHGSIRHGHTDNSGLSISDTHVIALFVGVTENTQFATQIY